VSETREAEVLNAYLIVDMVKAIQATQQLKQQSFITYVVGHPLQHPEPLFVQLKNRRSYR